MPGSDLIELRSMIFDGIGGRRFTQASPILPDVWLAYGGEPEQPQDLLITPHRDARAGQVARDLRIAVDDHRLRLRRAKRRAGGREEARVAHMPGLVAAKLHFDELIRLVLPRTPWWSEQVQDLSASLRHGTTVPALFPLSETELELVGAKIDDLVKGPRSTCTVSRKGQEIPHDFLWIVALIGTVTAGRKDGDKSRRAGGEPNGLAHARAFQALIASPPADRAGGQDSTPLPVGGAVFQVALNRPTEAAVVQSALAVKADAARLLFNISCKKITWAILDSGIDRAHPAFWDWSDGKAPPPGETKPSRVDRTYDFTRVRELLDPAEVAKLFQNGPRDDRRELMKKRLVRNLEDLRVPGPDREAPRLVRRLRDRLQEGLEIDWSLLEPLLSVPDPARPSVGHGTHVAGILGADWREPVTAAHDEHGAPVTSYQVRMQGMCPDIRLYDMRVLSDDSPVREFEVIAALQFIAYLNRRADAKLVHGANLSLSIPHEVTNHACGSTPVCEACDSLWANGLVLVAAAGNCGHQRYRLASGSELGGYHAISITDPGNAEGVITVGATHRKAHHYGVSYFSSRGPTGDGRRKPDLVAPGEKIGGPMPDGGEGEGIGTSCAAPHVSGAAAMLMARFEELRGRPARVKQILCGTATDLGREPYFQGAGMLDVLRALQSI
jgi:serine protease AprX